MSTPRSYLFVPGDRPDRYARALAAGAGAVIVDLEDAVAPDAKDAARAALAGWLAHAEARVIVRVNAGDTPWFVADLALGASAAVAGIMLPKAERPEDLARAAQAAAGKPLYPLIESVAGLEAMPALAATPGVERLVFGSIDFQVDAGIPDDGEGLLLVRSRIVLASRVANLRAPVDGVTAAIHDNDALASDAARACRLGFGAKLCIHPMQVSIVDAAFVPAAAEVAWARRVLDAAGRAGGAAVAVDGKMVDRPVVLRARAILERAGEATAA